MQRIPGENIAPVPPPVESHMRLDVFISELGFEARLLAVNGLAFAKKTYHLGADTAEFFKPFSPFAHFGETDDARHDPPAW